MITVGIWRDSRQFIKKIKVSGHADMALRGKDIVCAGVSSLVQAAVMGLERQLNRKIRLFQDKGELCVELIEKPDELTQAILETMLLGLLEIAKLYPKNVRVMDLEGLLFDYSNKGKEEKS